MIASLVGGTSPYPWPYHGSLHPSRTALVVAGAGADWAGRVPLDDAAARHVVELRRNLVAWGVLVVVVEVDGPWPRLQPVANPSTPIAPVGGEVHVHAAGLDGFHGSALDTVLRRHGRVDLLCCGLGLETTVHSTIRRANDRGYECLTVIDACAAHDDGLRAASRSTIEMSGGIFGAVGTTTEVLAAFSDSFAPTRT
jgi:biuret amidohydrolase